MKKVKPQRIRLTTTIDADETNPLHA